ncbi:hypothetical protein [Niabella sp.]|uniref:hypothetical protein n=1 Tax=Niabella sp. TaxID=1962976 RepID=UPI0026311977|nr:hypothetical protein [Niabella sp.]
MKQKLQLLLLLWILFPTNGKTAQGSAADNGKIATPCFGFALQAGRIMPGCKAKGQPLPEMTPPVLNNSFRSPNRIPAGESASYIEVRASVDGICIEDMNTMKPGYADRRRSGAMREPAYAVSMASVLLVAAAFFRIGRRRLMVAVLIVLTLVSAIIACYHNGRDSGGPGSIRFIRIAVTDKEGVRSYSEVVSVHEVGRH